MPFAFLNSFANFRSRLQARLPCGRCASIQRGAGMELQFQHAHALPGLGQHLHARPTTPGHGAAPAQRPQGRKRALSTSYFPVELYFPFHHLLTLDVEIRAGVHRAEKVLSIFFPSCRHQKGIVGSIAFYITAGLSIGDINLLPLSFSVWVPILSCVLKFLRRKCKWVYKLIICLQIFTLVILIITGSWITY